MGLKPIANARKVPSLSLAIERVVQRSADRVSQPADRLANSGHVRRLTLPSLHSASLSTANRKEGKKNLLNP